MEEGGSRGASPGAASMKELEAQVKTCQLCRLSKTRTRAVPGEGNTRAEVVFIGEGPGYHEDKQGRPFVGAAGNFLNELLQIAGLDRESVYITNVVKCRPPNNRDPEPDEKAACAPYLERQLQLINPCVVVTLGRHSMARFFPGERISQIHGTARMVDGRLSVAMYHPAAGLHQASLADVIRADFRKLPAFIEHARMASSPPPGVTEERLAEAEEAREEVIHEPETAYALPGDEAPNGHAAAVEAAEELFEDAQPSIVAAGAVLQPVSVLPAQVENPTQDNIPVAPARRKVTRQKKADTEDKGEFEQLTFF